MRYRDCIQNPTSTLRTGGQLRLCMPAGVELSAKWVDNSYSILLAAGYNTISTSSDGLYRGNNGAAWTAEISAWIPAQVSPQ